MKETKQFPRLLFPEAIYFLRFVGYGYCLSSYDLGDELTFV